MSAWFAFIFEPIMFIWVALRERLFPAWIELPAYVVFFIVSSTIFLKIPPLFS